MEVQKLARDDETGILTKRHLYALSQLLPEDQRLLALRIQKDSLTAIETEKLGTGRN